MKVKCEYCQSMVDSREKYCPSCGSPLPEVPARSPGAAPANRHPGVILFVLAGCLLAALLMVVSTASKHSHPSESSVSKAFAQLEKDPTNIKAYQTIITYQLDQGQYDSACRNAQSMLLANPGSEQGRWCVELFQTFDQPGAAVRLALLSDALTGQPELFSDVADTTAEQLLSDSPLRQAMELFFGKTAQHITLADLQQITFLAIGKADRLTNGRAVTIGRNPTGQPDGAVTIHVENGDSTSGALGLPYFHGLRRLQVQEPVQDPAELFLPNLRSLTVHGIQLEDFTPLSGLQQLEELSVISSHLTSLEGLDALPALRSLSLVDTTLSDLSNLASHKGVTELALIQNDGLTSVASLSQMTQLTSLTLSGKELQDLSPIASLTGLKRLTVFDTEIRNTAFLAPLKNLEHLSLYENDRITTVPELQSLTGLVSLRLQSDQSLTQEDMKALKQLKALELLSYKEFSYLNPLAAQLEELTVCFTRSEVDLSALSGFRNLRRLRFESENSFYNTYKGSLYNLKALQKLPLEELDLGGHHSYESLDPVLSIPTLRSLDLSDFFAEKTDFTKFSNLSQLETLDLSEFRDMVDTPPGPGEQYWSYEAGPASVFTSQLGRLTGLKRLNLSSCSAEDISQLSKLTGLVELNLADNNITDVSALENLPALTYLDLSGNPIADCTPVEGKEGLMLIQ